MGEGVTSGAGEGDAALAAAAVNSTHIVSINTVSFFMAQLYHGQVPCAICVNVKSIQRFCGYKVEHIICALYVGVYLRNLAYDYAFGYGRDMPGIISRMLAVSLRFTLYRDWFMPEEERVEQNSLYTLPAGVNVTLIRGPRPVR